MGKIDIWKSHSFLKLGILKVHVNRCGFIFFKLTVVVFMLTIIFKSNFKRGFLVQMWT